MRSYSVAVAAIAGAFLAAGIAFPGWAGRLLDVLVAVLAVSFVARRLYLGRLPKGVRSEIYAPFDRVTADRAAPELPAPIRGLADNLRSTAVPSDAARSAIPPPVQRVVYAEAARRLLRVHGLDLDDEGDHERIRRLVSDPTWLLIGPAPGGRSLLRDPVPQSKLEHILDDIGRI